jgi:hypothetical protein
MIVVTNYLGVGCRAVVSTQRQAPVALLQLPDGLAFGSQ